MSGFILGCFFSYFDCWFNPLKVRWIFLVFSDFLLTDFKDLQFFFDSPRFLPGFLECFIGFVRFEFYIVRIAKLRSECLFQSPKLPFELKCFFSLLIEALLASLTETAFSTPIIVPVRSLVNRCLNRDCLLRRYLLSFVWTNFVTNSKFPPNLTTCLSVWWSLCPRAQFPL